jgi:hypothetical protein
MNIKEIHVGEYYKLTSIKKSRPGCSETYFELFKNTPMLVTEKLNNFNNKNIIRIQSMVNTGNKYELVSFWCSPYDLKEIKE